jgi:hypothetical protein
MYPKLKINVYFIFLNIGDLTFGITLVLGVSEAAAATVVCTVHLPKSFQC